MSTLVLLTGLSGVLCIEARWQFQQRRLEYHAKKLGARVDFSDRSTTGRMWSYLILCPRTHYVSGVRVDAYLVDSAIFASPVVSRSDLNHLLSLPAAQYLSELSLRGTSVDDDLVDCLVALRHLKTLSVDFSAMSDEGARRLNRELPECDVRYGVSNGVSFLQLAHSEIFSLTPNVEDFALAEKGNPRAVRRLVGLNTQEELEGSASSDAMERIAQALRAATSPECQGILREACMDSRPYVRANAYLALAEQGDLRGLRQGLADRHTNVRRLATRYLPRYRETGSVGLLRKMLADPEVAVREAALEALAYMTDELACEALILAAQDEHPRLRLMAYAALAEHSLEEAQQALIEGLSDPNPDVRVRVVSSLRHFSSKSTLRALIRATQDADRGVRAEALHALSDQGEKAPPGT